MHTLQTKSYTLTAPCEGYPIKGPVHSAWTATHLVQWRHCMPSCQRRQIQSALDDGCLLRGQETLGHSTVFAMDAYQRLQYSQVRAVNRANWLPGTQ